MHDDFELDNTTQIPQNTTRLPVIPQSRYIPSRALTDVVPWVLEFRIIGTSHILRAPAAESFFFGRRDVDRNVFPDIDLSPYGGLKEGVSREHARLVAKDNRILVQDMGSSNGTFINGEKLQGNETRRLRDGDDLQLGYMNLQVNFIIKPTLEDETIAGFEDSIPIKKLGIGQHLLVLDENDYVCRVLHFVGARAGFRVTTVNTITEAIAKLENEKFDGLILELLLSEGSGLDVLRYLRKKIGSEMPVIAMSAMDGFIVNKARAQGANHFMKKPISVDELIEQLDVFST